MKDIPFTMYRDILAEGYDGRTCRVIPTAFRTPDGGLHIDYSMLDLSGSDVFVDRYVISSHDGGKTFSAPRLFNGRPQDVRDGVRRMYTLLVHWHEKTRTNYTIGYLSSYTDGNTMVLDGKDTMRALTGKFDAPSMRFTDCRFLIPPGTEDLDLLFFMEPLEEDDGTILVPAYCRPGNRRQHEVIVFRFAVEDGTLRFLERGPSITRHDLNRGVYEPRLTRLGEKYYLTLRSDETGWRAESADGLRFTAPVEWLWDDGTPLGSRNTQQAWLRHPDGLFLVYTRETPHNRHIFRNRAPLFMARFDEERGCLVRDTEVIAVPELGARLGNFTVTNVKENEAWICVAEWMQTQGERWFDGSLCAQYGANNRLWRIRITW